MAARLSGNRLARGATVLFAMSPFANMYFCMCCRSCACTSCRCWVHQFASFCSSDFAGPRWQVELEISPLWLLHPLQGNGLFILERIWEEFEVDWQRLGNVEDQFDNLTWDFVAMLVMSGFLFQFMRDLRLARFVRKAQLLIEQAKGRQFTSKHFSQVQA